MYPGVFLGARCVNFNAGTKKWSPREAEAWLAWLARLAWLAWLAWFALIFEMKFDAVLESILVLFKG